MGLVGEETGSRGGGAGKMPAWINLGLEPGSVTAVCFLVVAVWRLRVERTATRPLVSRTEL